MTGSEKNVPSDDQRPLLDLPARKSECSEWPFPTMVHAHQLLRKRFRQVANALLEHECALECLSAVAHGSNDRDLLSPPES